VNTHAGEQIQKHLDRAAIEYNTSINAALLFENNTVLNNIYVTAAEQVPKETETMIRLLAHSVTEIDMARNDLKHWQRKT
jgi:hypothetical protein